MNIRSLAVEAIEKVESGSYSNLVVDNLINYIDDSRDRALFTAIVYGVLRYKGNLDYIISQIANRPLVKIDKKVLIALRIAIYQINHFDRIPERAAVNETIEAVKNEINRGAVGFINGVLRNYIRKNDKIKWPDQQKAPVKFISKYYSHPEWIINKWIEKFGIQKTIDLCKYNNKVPALMIRRNTLKFSHSEFITAFEKENIKICNSGIKESFIISDYDNIEKLPLYDEGGFYIQGSAATLAGYILNPLPGMEILDMAAGPGGKTTHLAELMENRGQIIALDIYDHKINLINNNCGEMGINIVKTIKVDARDFKTELLFDKILLDVPCSGLGVIAQKPELRWRITPLDVKKLSRLQFELLEKALLFLRPGGELLYSTCTLMDKENIDIVTKFAEKYSDKFELLPMEDDLKRLNLNHLISLTNKNCLELFPPVSKTEGFFMAKIRKK